MGDVYNIEIEHMFYIFNRKGSEAMCEECQMFICPPACPNFDGTLAGLGRPRGRCSLCDGGIYRDEEYYLLGGERVCQFCFEREALDTLTKLCGYSSRAELFLALGAVREVG